VEVVMAVAVMVAVAQLWRSVVARWWRLVLVVEHLWRSVPVVAHLCRLVLVLARLWRLVVVGSVLGYGTTHLAGHR